MLHVQFHFFHKCDLDGRLVQAFACSADSPIFKSRQNHTSGLKPCHCLSVCLLVALTSQQHASVSQGRNCSNNYTCCHTETEVADQTLTPGAWQGSHWNASFLVAGMTRPRKNPVASGIRTRDVPLSRRKP